MSSWLCIWQPVCRWSDLWHLAVNLSEDVVVCAVCAPTPCQHPCPISKARLNTFLLEVAWDPVVLTTARSCYNVGCRTWNSWFRDLQIEKRRRIADIWGERSLVQMAKQMSALRGRKGAWGQEETRKLGNSWKPSAKCCRYRTSGGVTCVHVVMRVMQFWTAEAPIIFPVLSKCVQCSEGELGLCHKGSCSLQNPFFLCGRWSRGMGNCWRREDGFCDLLVSYNPHFYPANYWFVTWGFYNNNLP